MAPAGASPYDSPQRPMETSEHASSSRMRVPRQERSRQNGSFVFMGRVRPAGQLGSILHIATNHVELAGDEAEVFEFKDDRELRTRIQWRVTSPEIDFLISN